MPSFNKILFVAIAMPGLILGTVCADAQSKQAIPKKHRVTTIGFQSGKDVSYNSSPLFSNSKQGKLHYGVSNRAFIRKTIKPHFKVETGFNYSSLIPNQNYNNPGNKLGNSLKPYSVSVPATLQYYFLPEKCRVHPYCGAGLQYNLNINTNTISPFSGDVNQPAPNTQSGTRYISILFTQGVTFEVNTKIQITQSFHFIPCNNNRTLGIDLGIGYNIP